MGTLIFNALVPYWHLTFSEEKEKTDRCRFSEGDLQLALEGLKMEIPQ